MRERCQLIGTDIKDTDHQQLQATRPIRKSTVVRHAARRPPTSHHYTQLQFILRLGQTDF